MTQSDFRLWSWIDSHINLILGGLIVLFLSLLSLILFLILTSNEPANTKEKQPALPQTISQENVQSKTIQEQIEKAKKETTNGLKSVPSNSGTTAHIVNKTSGTVQSNDEQQNINSEQSQARNAQTGSDGNTAINKDANNNTITTGTRGDAAISANNQGNKQKNNVKPQEINSVIANNGSNVKGKVEKVSNVTAGGSSVNGTLKEKNYFLWLFLLNSIVIIVLLITVILYLKDIRNWVDIKYNELQTNNNEIQERESKISDNLNRFVTDNSNLRENVVADCKKNMETLIKENMETIKIKIAYKKYKTIDIKKMISGFEVSRKIIDSYDLNNVYITESRINIFSYYDSNRKVIRLVKGVFNDTSITSCAIASTISAYAILDKKNDELYNIRKKITPFLNLLLYVGYIIIASGLLFGHMGTLLVGTCIEFLVLLFHAFTFKIEKSAKEIARNELIKNSIVNKKELEKIEEVLNANSIICFASLVFPIAELIKRIVEYGNSNR